MREKCGCVRPSADLDDPSGLIRTNRRRVAARRTAGKDQMSDQANPNPAPDDPKASAPGGAAPASPENMAAEALKSAEKATTELGNAAAAADAGVEKASDEALKTAKEVVATAKAASGGGAEAAPLDLPAFEGHGVGPGSEPGGIELLSDVNLQVKIELGRTRMLVEDVLRLGPGSVVELDKLAGDPVDVFVNDRPVARGEVLVLNDNFCVRINEIVAPDDLE